MRLLYIIVPFAAGWSTKRDDGQVTDSDTMNLFVYYMKDILNTQPRIVFIDPKFADPSPGDRQRMLDFPPEVEFIPMKIEDYFNTNLERILSLNVPIAFVSPYTMSPFSDHMYSFDYVDPNNPAYYHYKVFGSSRFDPFTVIMNKETQEPVAGYNYRTNKYSRYIYSFPEEISSDITQTDLAILYTTLFYELASVYQSSEENGRKILLRYRPFVKNNLPDLIPLILEKNWYADHDLQWDLAKKIIQQLGDKYFDVIRPVIFISRTRLPR